MKLGIKVGPQKQSLDDLAATNPACAEVWFNINRLNDYTELFDALKEKGLDVGLHFWGTLADGTLVNIAYPDERVSAPSMALIQQTIDIAATHKFSYVNIHPGSRAQVKTDLIKMDYPDVSKPVALNVAENEFLKNAQILYQYALNHHVVFTLETVCARVPKTDWYNPLSRLIPLNIFELPVQSLVKASRQGLFIANDFGHTTAIIRDEASSIWRFVLQTTRAVASQTRLIHLGFVVPPYNGTDFHDMLDNPLFETNQAVPNKRQMIELLKMFKDRDDIWVITEPKEDHVRNYFLAKKILQEALAK